jgi:hypothetical protein
MTIRLPSCSTNATKRLPSNKALQPTPLRVDKIVGILQCGFGSNLLSIYRGGAAERQAVGPPFCLLWFPCCAILNASFSSSTSEFKMSFPALLDIVLALAGAVACFLSLRWARRLPYRPLWFLVLIGGVLCGAAILDLLALPYAQYVLRVAVISGLVFCIKLNDDWDKHIKPLLYRLAAKPANSIKIPQSNDSERSI